MLNILKSDFYKLKKSKAFWICTALCLVFGLIMVIAMQQAVNMAANPNHDPELDGILAMSANFGGAWMMGNLVSNGFHLMFIGVFTAIFVSSEFGYGTMKNTLSRGADRMKVYLSKLITCGAAAIVMFIVFLLTAVISGSVLWGFDPNSIVTLSGMLGMILPQALLVIAFTALFVFISMSMRSNGGAIAVNVLSVTMVSTLLSAISMLFANRIDLSKYWLSDSVSKLATVTPVSGDITQGIIVALAWGAAALLAGTILFKKQDVK